MGTHAGHLKKISVFSPFIFPQIGLASSFSPSKKLLPLSSAFGEKVIVSSLFHKNAKSMGPDPW